MDLDLDYIREELARFTRSAFEGGLSSDEGKRLVAMALDLYAALLSAIGSAES